MDTLVKIGVAGATPFVLQFLMDYLTNGNSWAISLRTKMGLSVCIGGLLGPLIKLYEIYQSTLVDNAVPVLFPSGLGWFFTTLNGGISGAIATAGVALTFRVAEKAGIGPMPTDVQITGMTKEAKNSA